MEKKECKQCGEPFETTDDDLAFYKKMTVKAGEKEFAIPTPTLCPTCRTQRRLAFRNDRSLYKSKSDLSGADLITMYNPDYGFKIYEYKEWWSDLWNPIDFGQEFNPDKSFFEQYKELQQKVPRFNIFNTGSENCDYVNYANHNKNCYLLFGSWFSENCHYSQTLSESKDSLDCTFLVKSELCYESVDTNDSYAAAYCQNCDMVRESMFCYDCRDVKNCLYCYNLRNKEYYINNIPSSKEEYEAEKAKLKSHKYLSEKKKEFDEKVKNQAKHRYYVGTNNENVSGNLIFGCKNAKRCFSAYNNENIAFCARMLDSKDAYDFDGGGKSELVLENMSNDFSFFSIGCTTCEHMKNSHYCDLCFNCTDCFGCVGLRQAQYCILNKQYTEEEYKKKISQIIEKMIADKEWGEFAPIENSQFAFNETMAYEYFPLKREEVEKRGWKWIDKKDEQRPAEKFEIPDNIGDVEISILNKILTCEKSGRAYKVIPHELDYLKKMGLPIPRLHPDERHNARMAKRAPRLLFKRNCAKCNMELETSYSEEFAKSVYCEKCYEAEVL